MIRAILFDLFGVIITDALKVVIEELAASDPAKARQIIDIIHANNRGFIDPAESNRQIADILGTTVAAWRQRIDQGEVKDARLLDYIGELRKQYKTALVSNIGRQSLHRRFAEGELEAHFDAVVASADLGIMKPDPRIYLHAAKELGVQPAECIMIDDRETHCAGADAAGMRSVLYQNFEQGKAAIEQLLADSKN